MSEQILNPDERVRKAAIGLALQGSAPKEGWSLLRRVRAGAVLRKRSASDVDEVHADRKESMKRGGHLDSSKPVLELDARRRALVESLGGSEKPQGRPPTPGGAGHSVGRRPEQPGKEALAEKPKRAVRILSQVPKTTPGCVAIAPVAKKPRPVAGTAEEAEKVEL